ncbi:MAG: hypothetical protein AAFN93_18930 [Bacteroidota bacterium]
MKKFYPVIAICLFLTNAVFSQSTIPFQGKLLENGDPVSGVRQFVFSIGDVSWTETQNLQVTDGFYSAVLGSVTPS